MVIAREEELLNEKEVWRQQALMYKAENERLNNNLTELKTELIKCKGENVLFRAVIKEVII